MGSWMLMLAALAGLAGGPGVERLPFLAQGATAHYEGSMDKRGGNADWDWWLYQDERGEWVLFDVDGPGCVGNFVQHRYPTSPEPVFRFYFDGEATPRFELRQSEFGKKPPFVKPLADIFAGDDIPPQGRGPIWVVRSFVPMPFRKGCRITSSVKLEGFEKAKAHGGWGHVIYQRYTEPRGVVTFTGKENDDALIKTWSAVGQDPKSVAGNETIRGTVPLAPGASAVLLERSGEGSIAAIGLTLPTPDADLRGQLWLRMTWDGAGQPAVLCPVGAFFGNEIGRHPIGFLTHGQDAQGRFYSYFPMPFWTSARIELLNRSTGTTAVVSYEVHVKPSSACAYARDRCGTFRTSPYYPLTAVRPGLDSPIADVCGRGRIVAATLTGRSSGGNIVSCEGDVRLHFDGLATPQIESDGSESYACYGWGFVYPPQRNPGSGYDGSGPPLYEFSETRVNVADAYPFRTGFRFGFEAGGCNDWGMLHSGVVLYYGRDEAGMELTDTVDVGDAASEAAHGYRVEGETWNGELSAVYEGDDDAVAVKDGGRAHHGASEFTVVVRPDNRGVTLRRRSDQARGRQRARVLVDGKVVEERTWYVADRNPKQRWLDDEFPVPARYTAGKDRLTIRLEFVPSGDAEAWTEFRYWVYSVNKEGNL